MKKLNTILFTLLMSLCITGCPWGYTVDDIDLVSPEELVALMNEKNLGTTFTLISSSTKKEKKNYKYLEVQLEAEDLPGKTVKAFHYVGYDEAVDVLSGKTISSNERLSFVVPSEEYLTDYFVIKYQDEIYNYFKAFYAPLLGDYEDGKTYLLTVEPMIGYKNRISTYSDYCSKNMTAPDAEYVIENSYYKTHLLINEAYSAESERNIYDFLYTLMNTNNPSHGYIKLYLTTQFSAEDVSTKALTEGSFYGKSDNVKVYKTSF